jgi:hypothetical protein
MTHYSYENEGIRMLDDFVCEAIPYVPLDVPSTNGTEGLSSRGESVNNATSVQTSEVSKENGYTLLPCPGCKGYLRIETWLSGKLCRCSHCGAEFSVPK